MAIFCQLLASVYLKRTGFVLKRKPHSSLFPPWTMYLLVAEKASAKETVLDWLVTQSPQAETREFRAEHGTVSEIDFMVSKLLYVRGQMK